MTTNSQSLLRLWIRMRASGGIRSPVLAFAIPADPIQVPCGPNT